MTSVKCPECSLTNWATAVECKRCRYLFQAFEPEDQRISNDYQAQSSADANQFSGQAMPAADFDLHSSYAPSAPYRPNYQQQNYQPTLKSGLAIASMVLGIVGFVTSILLVGVLIAPVGLILGIVALIKANKRPRIYGGKGFAIAGIVLSGLIVLFIPLIATIAIPNLLAARRAANEGSAISSLRTLSGAEMTFMAAGGGGRCGDLTALSSQKLIDPALAKGEKHGYRFMVINLPTVSGGCELHAAPVSSSTGTRSFYFSTEDGIMRAAAKNGKFADANDAPIDDSAPTYHNQPEKIATR